MLKYKEWKSKSSEIKNVIPMLLNSQIFQNSQVEKHFNDFYFDSFRFGIRSLYFSIHWIDMKISATKSFLPRMSRCMLCELICNVG